MFCATCELPGAWWPGTDAVLHRSRAGKLSGFNESDRSSSAASGDRYQVIINSHNPERRAQHRYRSPRQSTQPQKNTPPNHPQSDDQPHPLCLYLPNRPVCGGCGRRRCPALSPPGPRADAALAPRAGFFIRPSYRPPAKHQVLINNSNRVHRKY